MTPGETPPLGDRVLAYVPFVASAALVAFGLHLSLEDPKWAFVLGAVALAFFAPTVLQRRKMRRLLVSGDVDAILSSWRQAFDRVPHPETMAPLIAATAFASHGFVERARAALSKARRGPAWEAALEHRLVLETLLEAFEGDRERAVARAEQLAELPLPASPWVRARVKDLRSGIAAFSRAFAHRAGPKDVDTLRRAARQNPLVHWPLKYAAAVACIDLGARDSARRMLRTAPAWPEESVFRGFHEELSTLLS